MNKNKKIYILFLLMICSLILIFMNKQYIVSFYNDYVKKFLSRGSSEDSSLDIDNKKDSYFEDENFQKNSIYTINNGSNYVKSGNYTYYREYKKDNFNETGLGGSYSFIENSAKKMVRINEYGEREELFEDNGVGEIFILGERMYLKEYDSTSKYGQLYSVNFFGNNKKNYEKGKFEYIDEKNKKIIYSTEKNIVVINNLYEVELVIPDSQFICYDQEDTTIYFQDRLLFGNDKIQINSITINGSNKKELKSISSTGEYRAMLYIVNTQIKGEYVYISYGSFEGTMQCYQGSIARMKKDGKDFEVLTETDNEDFLVIEKDGKDYLIFDSSTIASSGGIDVCSMDLSNKEIVKTNEFKPRCLNVPFVEYKDSEDTLSDKGYTVTVSAYTDNKGNKKLLINDNDFEEINTNLYNKDEGYRDIVDIEYVNDSVYFSIEEGIRDEKNDVGWRYSYKRVKTNVYQKDLKTSQIKMINSY